MGIRSIILLGVGTFAVSAAPNANDAARADLVAKINAIPGITWTAAADPRFKGQPIGASKSLCGVKEGAKEYLEEAVRRGKVKKLPKIKVTDLPESFDSATNPAWAKCAKVIADIRDQSNCGCCWAFGAASAASDRLCIATNGTVALPLSAEDVCFCGSEDGCGGGMLPDAWEYIAEKGVVTGGQQGGGPFDSQGLCSDFSLPHCHHHGPQGKDPYPAEGKPGCPSQNSPSCPATCDSKAKAPHNVFAKDKFKFTGDVVTYPSDADTIAKAIMDHGPVEAAFNVYDDFENYAGGIYHVTSDKSLGGHAIRIVGWGVDGGVKYWKVANSWNPWWGEKGYFRIKRGTNEAGIEEQVTSSSSDSKWSGGVLPPAPPPAPGCQTALTVNCADAKTGGPSVCRGCCASKSDTLHAAGCTEAEEDKWCSETDVDELLV
eukprot:TRINITY_DN52279_c0_g1_i1.p1 TRINITY_DN52279_c0_g1~~TRINITY_DN52279_c0_g1_i1.p1  ORF type:complete len:432 (+),score=104.49 TRINITY_DN52279_c0_g1_i1:79-1374(+)